MNDLKVLLQGKKTYVVLAMAAVVWVLAGADIITLDAASQAYSVLALLGGTTVAAKINRLAQ